MEENQAVNNTENVPQEHSEEDGGKESTMNEAEAAKQAEGDSGDEASGQAEENPPKDKDVDSEKNVDSEQSEEPTEGGEGSNTQEETDDESEQAEGEDAQSGGEEKIGLFKRNKKKDKQQEKIEELSDQVKRQMAEFDNFRKRTEKEKSQMYEVGAKSIIEKILPVVDNFERGLAAVPEGMEEDPFVDGMNMIYKQFMTVLEEAGVTPIEAVGKEFDPNLHNAVMQVESEEYESGVVAQEMQKGYRYRDSVVRHSMVAVVS